MVFNIEVNNRLIQARKGETILSVLRRNGIHVPTLCNMKDFTPTGACRMCVIEVEGMDNLLPSCSFVVEDFMKIRTHSPRVLKARKTIVELLLSNHPDDCLYCERNGNCELQKLAEDLNIRERTIPGRKSLYKIDKSSPGIVRDPAKCILCGRCVRVCEEVQDIATLDFIHRGSRLAVSPAMSKSLNFSNCIYCGQCVIVCPTGAITEKVQFSELDYSLHDSGKKVIAQYSPTVSVSIAEEFGLRPGKDINGLLNAALRKIGFYKVFDTSFGADLMVVEQAEEFLLRLEKNENLPFITGCCPSWISFAEQNIPEILSNITSIKSPQQISGTLIKTWIAEKFSVPPADIYSVSFMPCTARKMEAQRVEMTSRGYPDVDTVLTTRELVRLIRLNGIDMQGLEPEPPDDPMGAMSSTGRLIGASGGTLESLLRTIYFKSTGKELHVEEISKLRLNKGIKEISLRLGDTEIKTVAVSGMAKVKEVLGNINKGTRNYHLVEIMACPGGCVNGGGQPISNDENRVKTRTKSLYAFDNRETVRMAHKNPQIINVYNDFLTEPMSKMAKSLFSVKYTQQIEDRR